MSDTETGTWRDLTLSLRRGQWHLAIEAPGLFSATASGSKESVQAVAEVCAAVRREYRAVTT